MCSLHRRLGLTTLLVAVALSFDFDNETPSLRDNQTSPGALSQGEYGARVGVPRILRLLERFSAPATFFMPAVSALLHDGEVKSYVDAGHEVALKTSMGKDTIDMTVNGEGPTWVIGVCPYGVFTRGKEPMLLTYYCKTIVGMNPAVPQPLETLEQTFASLKVDVVPLLKAKGGPTVKVLWEGKPLADAEVVLYVPGKSDTFEKKTDKDGLVKLEQGTKDGIYGVRAAHSVKK